MPNAFIDGGVALDIPARGGGQRHIAFHSAGRRDQPSISDHRRLYDEPAVCHPERDRHHPFVGGGVHASPSPITHDKLLIAVFGGFFLGMGIGLTMRGGAAHRRHRAIAVYLSKKLGLSIGDFILIFNIVIFSAGADILAGDRPLRHPHLPGRRQNGGFYY